MSICRGERVELLVQTEYRRSGSFPQKEYLYY